MHLFKRNWIKNKFRFLLAHFQVNETYIVIRCILKVLPFGSNIVYRSL